MAKTTCDGDIYVRNLSAFIKSHERQLANALVAYKKLNSKDQIKSIQTNPSSDSSSTYVTTNPTSKIENKNISSSSTSSTTTSFSTATTTISVSTKLSSPSSSTINNNDNNKNTITTTLPNTIDDDDTLTKEMSKPVRLSLSLHHLYFILGKFQELGILVGPMNLRLDNIYSDNNNNYVSFLSEFQRNKKLDASDAQSIHSISSVKSVMSSVSALWNTFSSTSKIDNTMSDLKYLYSAFSKLPCLRLANEPNAKLIEGHEEYPFETATPILIFKNLLVLEISDLDPKEIYGWNILSNKLRYLVIKKANITDPFEILVTLVEADSNVRGEEEDFMDNDDFKTENSSILKSDYNYDDYYDEIPNSLNNNKLTKTISNNTEISESVDKLPYRNSTLSSSIPLSHSSVSLVSSLTNNKGNHTSPTMHQSSSFQSTYNTNSSLNLHTSYNYNHHGHHHYHHNPLSSENLSSFSTSPTASNYTSNYHPNRLYAEDILASNSQQSTLPTSVHSTRRSYYYKPQKKSRRSRGSTSVINITPLNSNNSIPQTLNSNSYNNNNIKSNIESLNLTSTSANSNSILDIPQRKIEDLTKKNDNRLNETNDSKKSFESHNSDLNINSNSSSWKLLKHLSLTDNKIEKISLNSFDHLSNLTLLDLSYNNLTQIPSEPLSKLINLKTLNLSFNKLLKFEKFPKSLTKLTILNLRGNKITDLDSIENLSSLQKIDLRQNKLHKVYDLKPLLLLNKDKIVLTSVQLLGNPVAKSRGYRIELFNLFNGVDYNNNIRIDGSRPGIFESRMLLDEKTSKMRFKNYMDESIISKMTASVSNMNLGNILNQKPITSKNSISSHPRVGATRENSFNSTTIEHKKVDNHDSITPVLDQMTTSITVQSDLNKSISLNRSSVPSVTASINNNKIEKDSNNSSTQFISSNNDDVDIIGQQLNLDNISTVSTNSFKPPSIPPIEGNSHISPSPSMVSIRNPVTLSFLSSANSNPNTNFLSNPVDQLNINSNDFNSTINRSVPHSQRASNDFSSTTSSIATNNTPTANIDNNPIARLSLASPALPVITQATTTTMSITSAPANATIESRHSNSIETSQPIQHRTELFNNISNTTVNNNDYDENKENKSIHALNDDSKVSTEDFSSGLKISVI